MRVLFGICLVGLLLPGVAAWADPAKVGPKRLEPAECWFTPPDKISAKCYHLSVPESRAGRSDIVLKLPVAILSVPATRKHDDPVIYLAGGPGDGAWLDEDRIDFWWEFIA